jgi:hypothetical protein
MNKVQSTNAHQSHHTNASRPRVQSMYFGHRTLCGYEQQLCAYTFAIFSHSSTSMLATPCLRRSSRTARLASTATMFLPRSSALSAVDREAVRGARGSASRTNFLAVWSSAWQSRPTHLRTQRVHMKIRAMEVLHGTFLDPLHEDARNSKSP